MAYQTYITEALVCGSYDSNTSDRSYLLFSREAGMVYATARSVREERSKQRYALQEFSRIRATLVRGKGGWRIAGVEPLSNMYFDAGTRDARKTLRNVIGLLRRVMQGDTPHQELFDDVMASLAKCNEYDSETLELLLTLRILRELGYVAPHEAYKNILANPFAYEGVKTLSDTERKHCERAVEQALLSSQL